MLSAPENGNENENEASWGAKGARTGVLKADARASSLVLGIGNILLGDDGAGVRLVERLRLRLGTKAATFVDGGTIGFALLSYVEAAGSILVIDAGELDSNPGTTALFEGPAMDRLLRSTRRRTVHEVGLLDLLDMARLQDCLPSRRALLCIQPGHIGWSEALSAPVETALEGAVDQACALLECWRTG